MASSLHVTSSSTYSYRITTNYIDIACIRDFVKITPLIASKCLDSFSGFAITYRPVVEVSYILHIMYPNIQCILTCAAPLKIMPGTFDGKHYIVLCSEFYSGFNVFWFCCIDR